MFSANRYAILLKNNYKNINKVRKDLLKSIKFAIDNGAKSFIICANNKFNNIALNICREFRKTYSYLTITVVITDINMHFQRESKKYKKLHKYYQDVEKIIYYPDPTLNVNNQIYNFLITNSSWTISYITKPLHTLFKSICKNHYISIINLSNLQKVCYHKKNDELPHQILKSIII